MRMCVWVRACVAVGEIRLRRQSAQQAVSLPERGDRCLSKHRPVVASCFASRSIWPGSGSQLPEQLVASLLAWSEPWGCFQRSWNCLRTQGGVWEAAHPNQAVRWADPWIFRKLHGWLSVIPTTATNNQMHVWEVTSSPGTPLPNPPLQHLSQVSRQHPSLWFRRLL